MVAVGSRVTRETGATHLAVLRSCARYVTYVMDTVARTRGGEGHTPGITLMPHLGHSQGCVKPGVMSPGGDRVLT